MQRKLLERLKSRKFLLAFAYLVFTIIKSLTDIQIDEQVYWGSVVVVGLFIGVEGLIDKQALSEKARDKIDDIMG